MDPLKEAFRKVKEDIEILKSELSDIKNMFRTQQTNKPTNQQSFQTNTPLPTNTPTHTPTQNIPLEALKSPNSTISIRNQGVPTNQPTNQQTNQHPFISSGDGQISSFNDRKSNIKRVSEIIESLDAIKKEVRLKFKKLTDQEMLVFSTIYQLEEQGFLVDYQLLSEKLSLSEISIRDYIRKILKKEIPLDKLKEDNKKVVLSIPLDLKKIANLNTIYQLRNI